MRKWLKVIMTIFVVLVVLFMGASAFIGLQVFVGSTQLVTNKETKEVSDVFWIENNMNYESFCSAYKVEELQIASSFDDHIIPADYIYAIESQNSKDYQTVVLVHGLGGNRYSNYPLAEFFLKEGYNVITYDQRSSNENTARYTTFGYWEKYDLIDWVNYVEEQAPGQKIGIWGASFGGATTGLASGYEGVDEKVDFLILDCPVSSMEWMVEQEMRNMDVGIPVSYMKWCGNIINKLKLDFNYQDADVANAMKNVKTPVLIINSKLDSLTPCFMGNDIYDAIQGENKEIWTVDDSLHCEIWTDYNPEYCDRMKSFLSKYK
ncbi:alpha/beta hydrolase [Schnuerera sp. xch1]|uniref:alpha/beta hydrolase n=1 Tax=Schnuerera sp. xch1 TaxID=2874283 RepID=UPI001CBD8339|nr:alpha/beta hydrolase [Schnuerera sp. xch1]MBZ2175755.1 alpha/beta hydrolase [Schnuerera sp. xch1]